MSYRLNVAHILFVDDDVDILGLLAEYFHSLGHQLVLARNGREAFDVLRTAETSFDVAVVDWSLPDISGKDVVAFIRQNQPKCRILVTTGHGNDMVSEGYIGSLVLDIVRKPFTLRNLSRKIDGIVQASEAR